MNLGTFFGGAVVLLQTAASLSYAWQRQWPAALIWLGAGIANAAVLWQTTKGG